MPQVLLWLRKIRHPSCPRMDLIMIFFKSFDLLVSSLSCSLYRMNRCISFWSLFLSHVHHAVFLILFLLQRNQDVDSVVLEHVLWSTRVPNFSRYEFSPLMLQFSSGLPMQVRFTEESAPQSTQYLTKTWGICHPCAIFPKWFCNHHAWVGELSATSPWFS